MIDLVAVRYEKGIVEYFFTNKLKLTKNTLVLVETDRGLQVGECITDAKNYDKNDVSDKVRNVVCVLSKEDKEKVQKNTNDALMALEKAKKIAIELKLDMHFIDAYYTFDRNQLIFNFTADNRVDFRELAKRIAQIYHTRIELRQVGVRDKAKEIGGIGPCGRFLCCSTFLTDFDSVSINMAKNQYIALNPTKINGVCGRLLCCLKYEDEQYTDMKKGLPKIGQMVEYNGVKGKVSSINLLTKRMMLEQPNKSFVEVSLENDNGSIE